VSFERIPPDDDERTYPPSKELLDAFYQSWAWKTLAYRMKMRDGRRCQCCGADKTQARIVSDHIKPIRLYWHLRFVESNIQTLCEDCNKGKGSWDETDHRQDSKQLLLAEIIRFQEPLRTQQMKQAIITAYSFDAISEEDAMQMIKDYNLAGA